MSKVEKLADGRVTLHCGDCLEVLKTLLENSIDAVVTDPPYHFTSIVKRFGKEGSAPAQYGTDGAFARASRGFMGKEWDGGDIAFRPETWAEVLRVMKPGAHLVAFGAPKNYHRLACAIEDAGFEIRDSLMWVFGSGFPKSLDVSKAIDKASGAEREKIAIGNPVKRMIPGADQDSTGSWIKDNGREYQPGIELAATDAAREWSGWGTALKPAYEPIVLARKPLSEGTVAANVLRWGTGALNIDATRIENAEYDPNKIQRQKSNRETWKGGVNSGFSADHVQQTYNAAGRWPANLCHDGSQGVLDLFPHTSKSNGRDSRGRVHQAFTDDARKSIRDDVHPGYGDEGSAARFFYCPKASKHDRAGSKHPTVKPINLMRWLVRMVTPPSGTVLDLFAGSGTTGMAAILECFDVQLIERESEYQADIRARFGERQDKDIPICDDVADTHV